MFAFNERAAAVAVLTEVLENKAYANLALRKYFKDMPALDPRGRAFVTELVNETLRNLLRIDAVITAFNKSNSARLKPFIRNLLRISVCQLRFLRGTADYAAVNEAVALTKKRGMTPLSGFVNGLLRAVIREPNRPALPAPPPPGRGMEGAEAAYLAAAFSYPEWLSNALVDWLGPWDARRFCAHSHQAPDVTVFTNTLRTTPEALAGRLRSEGVDCAPGVLHQECLHLRHTGDLAALSAYREGLFHVIDEGAVSAAKALAPKPGQTVLDLCAAPGGKAFVCAILMHGAGTVQASDIHPHKLRLMEEAAARLGLKNVRIARSDARSPVEGRAGSADAVLLDAPCTGFGIIRKRPEIKYARLPEDVAALAAQQREMLQNAAAYVKPGGALVYCTCTLSRAENRDNAAWFAGRFPFAADGPPPAPLIGAGHDAFFIARFTKGAALCR